MKNKTYFNIIGVFFAAMLLLASCEKDDPVKLSSQIATWEISNITSSSADVSGFVVAEGAGFSERGICWSTSAAPTVADSKALVDKVEGAVYVAQATGLSHVTKYYVRAYATSLDGTVLYGDDTSFTTLPLIPTISATTAVTDITGNSATSGGNITYNGGAAVTAKGVCWSTDTLPTLENESSSDGTGIGTFTSSITGLTGLTKYYVRSYATNSAGTAYGVGVSFTTEKDIPTEGFLVGSINGWDNHGLYLAALGSDIHVGYQYLDDAAEFKFLPVRDTWDNAWGRDGTNVGTIIAGGSDNVKSIDEPSYSGAGFYEIRFDLANETVTLSPVAMGVIGDAQAGGWGTDVDLTYNITSKKWEGQVDFLATGEYKFRANDDWVIDFGGDLNNLVVSTGGNFATPGAGTWNVTLDLGGVDAFTATVSQYPAALYMVGDGVSDWSWTIDLPMVPVHSHPELFWKIVWMNATGSFKINSAKAWDGNEFGRTNDAPVGGVYTLGTDDNVPVPGTAGYYMVVVDLANNTIEVADPKVYGIGNAFGGSWTASDPTYLFTVDNANDIIKFDGIPDSGDLRMHVAATTLNCDWWQAEFSIIGGNIEFRETGGDQAAVPVTSGQNISLNFKLGTGTITP